MKDYILTFRTAVHRAKDDDILDESEFVNNFMWEHSLYGKDIYDELLHEVQQIKSNEEYMKEVAIKTILEEVKQKCGKIVLKEPFKYSEFSSYHTLYSNGNLSGYYKNPREYSGDTIPCTVPIENLSTLQLKKITELI